MDVVEKLVRSPASRARGPPFATLDMGIHNTVKAANAMTSEACDLSDLSNEDLSNEALSELASELDAKDAVLDKSIDTSRAQAMRVGKDVNRTLSSNDDHC